MIKHTTLIALLAASPLAMANDLIITHIYDGPLTGGVPKGVAVKALNDISDLSQYGLGSANNGGSTDGEEFTFPNVAVTAGETLYIASESAQFAAFFGFAPDYTSSAMAINGDDAIELFYNGAVIDLFGDINVDGTGQAWDYMDGWAARLDTVTQPSASFDLAQWAFSGPNALDGANTNASATSPIPVGTPTDPNEPPAPQQVLISAIQGNPSSYGSNQFGETDVSPLLGQSVTIEGIVVGDFQRNDSDETRNLNGFYLQEETTDSDNNPLSSEGIFVYDNNFGVDVSIGDRVKVSGTVDQYFGETQLSDIAEVTVVDANLDPTLSLVTTAQIDLASNTDTSVNQNGVYQPDLEAYEGMLVELAGTLQIIEQFQLDRFNEIRLIAGERPAQYSQIATPDPAGYTDYQQAIGARSIVYDDGLNEQNTDINNLDGFAPYSDATAPRMGDTATNLTGVLDYKWAGASASGATWRVRSHIDGSNTFTRTADGNSPNPRPSQPHAIDAPLKVASFNVLNFFKTLDAPNQQTAIGMAPRGADDLSRFGVEPADLEYQRQLAKLVNAITALDADILGLVELENEFDTENDGSTAIEALVNALNTALGEARYDYVFPGSQFVGTDAIAVGFIYNRMTVSVTPGSTPAQLNDTVVASLPSFSSHDLDNDPIFDGEATNRVSLAVNFTHLLSGEQLTVVANHFKSKGQSGLSDTASPNYDQNDGAGYWNQRRLLAAMAVTEWLATNPTGIDDNDQIILGDLNAYAMEGPVQYLLQQGFNNVETEGSYSYVFSGQTGTLDYLLVSDSLQAKLVDAAIWHINADEADAIDYNLDFGRSADLYSADQASRNSDHDPVVAGFLVNATPEALLASFKQAVERGLLSGNSRHPKIQERMLRKVKHNLKKIVRANKKEKYKKVCRILERVNGYSDGRFWPYDLLQGEGLKNFNQQVNWVSESSNCQSIDH